MRNRYLYITLLAVLGWNVETQGQTGNRQVPRLVVNITIDQLRSDYLEAFTPLYGNDGFKRLTEQGVVFAGTYPFDHPDRASAISTILTGTTPFYHGIVGLQWMDRSSLRPVRCTEQMLKPGVATPDNLTVSTLGDELKVSTNGEAKIFAIAPYQDMAVLSAGHAADNACWMDERTGQWTTSQYYANNAPNWLLSFNELRKLNNISRKYVWRPLDAPQGRAAFEHVMKGENGYRQYLRSALINSDITELALQSVANLTLGSDSITDLLCLTYYAGLYEDKPVTDCQSELKDTYLRLDRELGKLINDLEQKLGKEHVLFVVTSTGEAETDATDYAKYRIPTGTFYINRAANLLNMYFGAQWGQARYIETSYDNQIFVNHKLLEQKRLDKTEFYARSQAFLAEMAGVKSVYTSIQLQNAHNDHLLRMRNSFSPQRCGDILIEVAPGWRLQHEDTGSNRLSQVSAVPFPVIFYGGDLQAEHVKGTITTDRIAPTLAKAIRIRAPNACSSEPLF